MAKSKIYEQTTEWLYRQRRLYLAGKLSEKKRQLLEQLPQWAEFIAEDLRPKKGIKVYICDQNPYSHSFLQRRRWRKKPCHITYAEAKRRRQRGETGILTDAQAQELLNEAAQIPPTEEWIKSHPGYVYGYYESEWGVVTWDKSVCWVFHPEQRELGQECGHPTHTGSLYGDKAQRPLTFNPHPAWAEHIPEKISQAYLADFLSDSIVAKWRKQNQSLESQCKG